MPAWRPVLRAAYFLIDCLSIGSPMSHPDPVSRTWPVVAALVGVAGETVAIAASTPGTARWNEVAVAAVVVAYAAVGLLILSRRPGHVIGRTAVAIAAVWGVGQALVAVSYRLLVDNPDDRVAALGSVVGGLLRGLPWFVAVLWLPVRFPDGAPPTTRLRRVAERLALVVMAVATAVTLLSPNLNDLRVDDIRNPIGLPEAWRGVTDALAGLLLLLATVSIGLAVACLVQRYRTGGALTRQQTVVFGVAFVPPVAALAASATDSAGPWLFAVATIPLPVAIGVACLQNRLYDLDLVLNQSLTYGALWLVIAAMYALTVGGVGAMLQQRGADWLPWVAAGVVAVSFAPVRDALQRGANKLTYGSWSQPGEVLAATGRRLSDATDVPGLLHTLTEELGDGLGLGYVEIVDGSGTSLARRGVPDGGVAQIPLQAYGAPVGTLRWSGRPLRDPTAPAAHRRRRAARGRRARGRAAAGDPGQPGAAGARPRGGAETTAAGPARRPGPGPGRPHAPGGHVAQPARRGGRRGPARLRAGIQSTVLDVRRIVEGLRPPSLDELGLAEALAQVASRLQGDGGPEIRLGVEVGELPAAVEVAAYRIAQEALTNAVRHAEARNVALTMVAEGGDVVLRVCDDGCGVVRHREDGVGLSSMRARRGDRRGARGPGRPGRGTTVTAQAAAARRGARLIRVLVVDDHPMFREGLAACWRRSPTSRCSPLWATATRPSAARSSWRPTWCSWT